MKERGMTFVDWQIKAILAGATQTRRVVRFPKWADDAFSDGAICQPSEDGTSLLLYGDTPRTARGVEPDTWSHEIRSPYGVPGDRLYVREAFWCCEIEGGGPGKRFLVYDADWPAGQFDPPADKARPWCWSPMRWGKHPPRHMPKAFARTWLDLISVRGEQVQDISADDCLAELGWPKASGTTATEFDSERRAFASAWDSENANRGHGWDGQDWFGWVWVHEWTPVEVTTCP